MGYIKKLKNNELVGGTDKTTIYPVTSAEAVFEEVGDNEFKSQKYLNNHITNERIVDNTIENSKLKDDTIDMGKLNTQLKTIIQNAYDASWKVKEEPFSLETKYDANDIVYDPATNSSYVSLTADNQGNPVNPEDEGYVEGKWRVIINGISAVESTEVINAKVEELETEIDNKIDDAQEQLDAKIADVQVQLDAVTQEATDAALEARDAASTVETLTSQQVADAQVGYFECTDTAASGAAANETKITTTATIGTSTYTKVIGSHVKIKMAVANTHAAPVYLQFGNQTNTKAPLLYNGEAVSASNTWEANEVISVYFDGTNYQASNAQGGSNKKIDTYLLGDLRTLAIGEIYTENEAVKTADKQLLRVTKDVKTMNLTDEVASGDLKAIASGTYVGTYKAQKNVKSYVDTTYTDGDYALGSPAGAIIQVTVDSTAIAALEEVTNISVTIAGVELTVAIDSTMDAIAVAAAIVTAFGTQSEWKLVDNSDGTINLISKIAKTESPTISSDTGETGVTVGFVESSDYAGTTALSKYDGTAWAVVADLDTYASDFVDIGEADATKMWKKLNVTDLVASYTKQNSVANDFLYNSNAYMSDNLFDINWARIGYIGNTREYHTRTIDKTTNTIRVAVAKKDGRNAKVLTIYPFVLEEGKTYKLTFSYYNNLTASIPFILRTNTDVLIKELFAVPVGGGTVDFMFTAPANVSRLSFTYPAGVTANNHYITITNLFIREVYNVSEVAENSKEGIENVKTLSQILTDVPLSTDYPLYIEEDYTWNINTTDYRHYAVPVKSEEKYIMVAGNAATKYGFLTSPTGTSRADVTTWLPGYETLMNVTAGEEREIVVPKSDGSTIYLYIVSKSFGVACGPSSLKKYTPVSESTESMYEQITVINNNISKLDSTVKRLELTEKDEDGITYTTYTGNPLIPVYNKFGWKNIGPTADYRTEQACSIWGDYAFGFNTAENTGSCALDIVNLKTRKTVGAYKGSRVYNIPTDGDYHMGSSQFSNIYYDENDEFPLIYIEGITNNLIVGRVVPENSAQLYHIEIVQVIDYSGITDNNATYHVAFDHTRGYLVLFHGGWMKIKTLLPPAIKDGNGNYITNVSITDADLIEQYEVSGYTQAIDVPQSGSCHNGLLFYTNGIGRNEQRLIVIDLRTRAVVNDVSTWQLIKQVEPESIDFWGEIPILFTRGGMFRLWF